MFDEANSLANLSRPMITNASIAAQRTPQNYIQRSGGEMIDLGPSWKDTRVNGMPAAISPNQQDIAVFSPSGQYQTTMAEQQAIAERRRQEAELAEWPRQMALAKLKEQQMKAQSVGLSPAYQLAREKFEWEKSGGKATAKPLPVSALKLQQEELDAIGSSSALNKDLGAFTRMIETGELPLGPVTNLGYKARNLAGASTEESRNYASFQANLERLRNESLRLNKGVQTEGDAIRAWNEIVANINDPDLVAQRLKEVQKVNERAIQLRKMNIDAIRSNFGQDPMDVSGRVDVPSAYDGGGTETPRVGSIVDGYVYTGGNPADPSSWKEQ